jgi:hypothetical protein
MRLRRSVLVKLLEQVHVPLKLERELIDDWSQKGRKGKEDARSGRTRSMVPTEELEG